MGSRPLPHGRAPELHQKGARKKPSEKSPRQTLRVSPFGLPPFAQGMCAKVTVGRPSDWAGDCSRVTAMAVAADSHRISLLEDKRTVTRRRLLLSTDPDKVYYNKKGEKSQDAAKGKVIFPALPLFPISPLRPVINGKNAKKSAKEIPKMQKTSQNPQIYKKHWQTGERRQSTGIAFLHRSSPSSSVSTLTLGMRELTKNSQLFLKKPLTIGGKRDIL